MIDFLWSLVSIGIFATIFLIGVYAIWKIRKEKRLGFPTKDERTQKITGLLESRPPMPFTLDYTSWQH